jgi:alpha-amylase/alpha-mannosidase (GH57 family)
VGREESAAPYHDWNERITAECYSRNAAARVMDDQGGVARVLNNFSRASFNLGPTLMGWLESHSPEVYGAILEGDRWGRRRFAGHGTALAQAYNHVIMPLASHRDRRTQVLWGVRDFVWRFGRQPEGMWLPETAVDLNTLEALAEAEIRFTILSPRQADRVRHPGTDAWCDVSDGAIDTGRAYLHRLPSGRSINLFFYDAEISQGVAFGRLLEDGGRLAESMLAAFPEGEREPRLVSVATDGETYGHHHPAGEMALAEAISRFEDSESPRLTCYGQFLSEHPPELEVEVAQGTAWSCDHGVDRWQTDCGCATGANPAWNQTWREPLREALDLLAGHLSRLFEDAGGRLLRDPWEARDQYIEVLLDRSAERFDEFLARHGTAAVGSPGRAEAVILLEMQRYSMLMFTSCGWFFDDAGGIETRQVLLYAGRALELAEALGYMEARGPFLARLEDVSSNRADVGHGRAIFESAVAAARAEATAAAAKPV